MEVEKLISQYKENEQKIVRIHEAFDKKQKIVEKRKREIWSIYYNKRRALEQEEREQRAKIDDELDSQEKKKNEKCKKLSLIIEKVQRIREFLRIEKDRANNDISIKRGEVCHYDSYNKPYIECLGFIFNDEFLKIKLWIAENDKPKNKYTLIAFGKTIFTEQIIKFPYSYGIHLNDRCKIVGFSLKSQIRDAPTVEELKAYLKKNNDTILASLIGNYEEIKKEYLETVSKYKISDFDALVKYCCKSCGFSLTKKESQNWSLRDKKCPKCEGRFVERNI